ncbi:MAG: aconitase X [Roseobacter sp.]
MQLTQTETAILSGDVGRPGDRMAMTVVVEAARMLGADRLVPVTSAHIDGCLYHGTSGTLFCERLVDLGAQVNIPTTTNVGALNLLDPAQSQLQGEARKMAYRLMVAHERMGCRPSWTCAPYQAGARPDLGAQVAWGESNAVAFCNSVLGARTNRYGDFLDIACAITGRAPHYGLHLVENRKAQIVCDISTVPVLWQAHEVFFPVLGALLGRLAGASVCAVTGILGAPDEDALKAMCAGAASTGAVGLIHVVGVTPEAPTLDAALGNEPAHQTVLISAQMIQEAYATLTQSGSDQLDAVALGSPHFSATECRQVLELAGGTAFDVPVYICLGRHTLQDLKLDGSDEALKDLGAVLVVDTCVVVTPILPETGGVLMTNSAKFAHYATPNTGYTPVFACLADCVASAQAGRVKLSSGRFL